MTSLSTSQAAAEPATGTADAAVRSRTGPHVSSDCGRRRTGSGSTPCSRGRCRGRVTSGRRWGSPMCWPWCTATCCATGPRTRTGRGGTGSCCRSGTTPSRCTRVGRGGDHPGRGAGDLRFGRVAAADVGDGVLHPGDGDLRRLARARPDGRDGDGAGVAASGQPGPGLQPAVRRRARRGLHLGGGTADRPPPPGQCHRDRGRQRPAGRRSHRRGSCGPSRAPTSGRRSGGRRLRVDGNDVAALVDAFDELARHKGSPGC
jgi:hypothetical protein